MRETPFLSAPSLCIRFGINAGQPRPATDTVLDRITSAKRALVTLKHKGFDVISVEIDQGVRPTITIEHCGKCAALIASGQAVHYKWITSACGREVWGQWLLEDCRVIWVEEGGRA